jgi:hypothetical protein
MKKILEWLRLTVWAGDQLWRLVTVLIVAGGSTAGAVITSGSELLKKFGPVAWLMGGIITGLSLSLIIFLIKSAQKASAEAALATAFSTKQNEINPLLSSFSDKVISVSSLFLPGQQLHENKQFLRCKFVGPGVIALMGGNVAKSEFNNSGYIITIPEGTWLTGVTVFRNCTVDSCEFIGVTLIIPREHAAAFQTTPGVRIAM